MKIPQILIFVFILLLSCSLSKAESGYDLWLRYKKINDEVLLENYRAQLVSYHISGQSPTLDALDEEFRRATEGLLDLRLIKGNDPSSCSILIGKGRDDAALGRHVSLGELESIGPEGFLIKTIKNANQTQIIIIGNQDIGLLYGTFHFIRLIQTNAPIDNLYIKQRPQLDLRVLNHWDNLDRTSERGYAGFSIWDWHRLPEYLDPRYTDYARANAAIGINGTVLNNVNSNALILTPEYLEKVRALAGVFRPYGIKVYLTARFSAPVEIGGLETADPLDEKVIAWWKEKVKEIHRYIPDFGGFLVKANSEGQPGPQNYGRTHADGANMLADALTPHQGVVMWRAFVYSDEKPDDRAKQAYDEFKPLDGTFRKNVLIQVKNGPIDFQPREPFHPLFGAMPKTPLMMEFQVTQEYLGQATHLTYLAPMWKECLNTDTYAKDQGSTVAKVLDSSLHGHALTGIAGVANTGTDINWTGHPFAQANWYAYGRLAWNMSLPAEHIAEEWIRMTYSNEEEAIATIKDIMMSSWEATVNYMTPLGLHHLMGTGHHYGPAPWVDDLGRADWTPVYYHRADKEGIGFDRSASGSNAVEQYFPEVTREFGSPDTCPEKFLLWFHHVSWDRKMSSGRTLWEELAYRYQQGVNTVRQMQDKWQELSGAIDPERHRLVTMLLTRQEKEAVWWKDACMLYFQTFSDRPFPDFMEKPEKPLSYYQSLKFPYAPGG